jgi:hypothetical protein
MEKSMKLVHWVAAAALLSLALLLSVGCQNKSTNPGTTDGTNVGEIQIVLGTPNDTISFLPGDTAQTTVDIIVKDRNNVVMPKQRVEFSLSDASLGFLDRVTPANGDTTDENGRLKLIYHTYGQDGVNLIVASSGGKVTTKAITVLRSNQVVSTLSIHLDRYSLMVSPNMEDSVSIKLTISDAEGHGIKGIVLPLTATGGRLRPPPPTDTSGVATTTWYSNYQYGTFYILTHAGGLRDSIYILVQQAAIEPGVLRLNTDTRRVKADDCVSGAHIFAILQNQDGQAISKDTVRFGTPPKHFGDIPLGYIEGYAVTDSTGKTSTVTFCGGTIPCEMLSDTVCDSAIVVAKYYKPNGWNLVDTLRICIESAAPIGSVYISANPLNGTAGVDSASIQATVNYSDGAYVDGYWMRFFSNPCGIFTYDSIRLVNGHLQVANFWKFCEQIPPDSVGDPQIYATVDGIPSNQISLHVRPGEARKINIETEPDFVEIGQTAQVTAYVLDSLSNAVGVGQIVSFSSSLGTLADLTASTDIHGVVRTEFNPGTTSGSAVIKATLGSIAVDSTVVTIGAGGPNTISLDVSSPSLVVAGSGGIDWTQLRATVRDANGNPVPNGRWVTFEIMAPIPGSGCHLNNTGTIDSAQTSNGLAVATLNAGNLPGPVIIQARTVYMINDTTPVVISATKSNISIVSGPPAFINVFASDVGVDVSGGTWEVEVSALVSDVYLNPVQCGIAVFFELTPDTAQISSADVVTCNPDKNNNSRPGVAYTTLRYLSPATFQTVFITARTAGSNNVSQEISYTLPLQTPSVDLTVTPIAWNFLERTNPSQIQCLSTVKDGHDVLINGATVVYQATRGKWFPTALGGSEIINGQRVTGQPPNNPGECVAWLRADMNYVFTDPNIPEITSEVNVSVLHYSSATDGAIVLLQRIGP